MARTTRGMLSPKTQVQTCQIVLAITCCPSTTPNHGIVCPCSRGASQQDQSSDRGPSGACDARTLCTSAADQAHNSVSLRPGGLACTASRTSLAIKRVANTCATGRPSHADALPPAAVDDEVPSIPRQHAGSSWDSSDGTGSSDAPNFFASTKFFACLDLKESQQLYEASQLVCFP